MLSSVSGTDNLLSSVLGTNKNETSFGLEMSQTGFSSHVVEVWVWLLPPSLHSLPSSPTFQELLSLSFLGSLCLPEASVGGRGKPMSSTYLYCLKPSSEESGLHLIVHSPTQKVLHRVLMETLPPAANDPIQSTEPCAKTRPCDMPSGPHSMQALHGTAEFPGGPVPQNRGHEQHVVPGAVSGPHSPSVCFMWFWFIRWG